MAKNKVEILALLDKSGSMHSIIQDAVDSFNEFIEEQQQLDNDDKVKVTLNVFSTDTVTLYDRVKLEEMPKLSTENFQIGGMTGLNDAIGNLITSTKHPDRDTIVLIQTDGRENASTEYSAEDIRKLVETKEAAGWDFTFVGAGLDDMTVANMAAERGMGKSISVAKNAEGMDLLKSTLSAASTAYRTSR